MVEGGCVEIAVVVKYCTEIEYIVTGELRV